MASVLDVKNVDSAPSGAPYTRPSKIPVRTSYSSGSASDDSDNSSKSESKPKTGGKSYLPVPVVKSPAAKKVPHSSKPAGTSGSESDPETNSTEGVEEKVVPTNGAQPIKMPARLKSLKLKKKSSVNQARSDPLARSLIPGIKQKQTPVKASSDTLAFVQQGRLRPARKFQVEKTDDLTEKEQQRSFRKVHIANQKDEPGKTEADESLAELPVQDLCAQSCFVTCSDGMGTTAGKPSASEKDEQSGKSGSNRQEVAGGSCRSQGSSVGGSGDGDDPNNPNKPKLRKEPEDKKDEDDEKHEKERAASKELDKQTLKDELTIQEDKTSQTDEEEESVGALQKTIRSKDKEIVMMQKLVDCCRKDYEELQESFNQYTKEFQEVDENRAKISALTNENNILKKETLVLQNQVFQKTSETTQAQERSKKLKNMLSKMEVDLDFLETEKKELLAKLKLYEANAPLEKTEAQKVEETKEQMENRLEHGLGRSCSLQNVEAMKTEEENAELKNKLHHCEDSLKSQKKECIDFKERLAKTTKKEEQLKSRIQRLTEENDVLNTKCSQLVGQWKEFSIGEKIEDLRKLQRELFEASKDLATEGNELKVTSSPLSVELAEADTLSQTQLPEANQSGELQILIHSLAAMTEELRERIKKTKAQMAKAYPANDDELDNKNDELVKQLNEEIASLHMKLEEDAAKIQQLGQIAESSNTERQRLEERIEELEKELCKAEDNLTQTQIYKDRELNNIRHDSEMKELKAKQLADHLEAVLEAQDSMRTLLQNQYSKIDRMENKETELKNYVEELELENETLLKDLSEQKLKLLDVRRENIEKEEISREDFEKLQNALTNKIDSMTDVINDFERIQAKDPFIEQHPCTATIESAMQILYDISGLLKAIGHASLKAIGCSCSSNADQVPGPSTGGEHEVTVEEEARLKELDDLKEQLNVLKEGNVNLRLEKKKKEKRVRFAEGTKGGESDEVLKLLEQLQDKETQLEKLKDQTLRLQAKNGALTEYLSEVRDKAVRDTEGLRGQAEVHLNHIQKLQADCETQRLCVKKLKTELSECKEKNATLEKKMKEVAADKQALEQKLKTLSQDMQKSSSLLSNKGEASKDEGEESISGTPSSSVERDERIKALQGYNEKLNEKIDMFEAFFEQVKEDKAQNARAIEASRLDAMMLKAKSDEQITELEKKLEDKSVLETKLQDTVTSLEKRISTLEAEKLESENQLKAMVESMTGQNELENYKKEYQQLELELRNSILTLTAEKSETQKELEEQKSVVAKASESLEIRMKEFDECLRERQVLQEELADLKSTHSKQKEDMAKKMKKMGLDIDEYEAEVKLVRQSSSEIISELEKQLKDRRDSETELKERAEALSQLIDQLKEEKLESDKKIQDLMNSIDAKEKEAKLKRVDENHDMSCCAFPSNNVAEKAQHDVMLVRKESAEKIAVLEKRLQEQTDSESMLQEKVHSLESRISQLNDEKAERDDNMKKLMEAMDVNTKLAEIIKKKEQVERELTSKVEEMKLKLSRIKSTKKYLERQLAKKETEFVFSTRTSKCHSKQLQDDLDECLEREKELNERIKRLSEDSRKAEERESQIKALENQMLSKRQSESGLQEKMIIMEEKISRLEAEKSQHCKNISSIIRKLKTKEDLDDAITARDEAEKEYKVKIDEMEVIVNKLRKERSKADCDEELKERYRQEYEESRRNVRRLTENVNRCNERVKELKAFVSGSVEDEPKEVKNLHENIEDLKRTLKVSDAELFKKLQSLNEKITHLEDEKAEGEKMITAMLKSMEEKEKMEHCIATSREADKNMLQNMNEMAEAIKKLRTEKNRVEDELQKSEKLRATKECESELIQNQTDEKISSLQQSLNKRCKSEWKIQKRLEAMSNKLAQMESAKEQADKTIQTMLESLQWKDNLEHCLEEKDKIEKELKRRVQQLKLENKEAFMEAKNFKVQCREAHLMKEQISSLTEQLLKLECDKQMALESMKELLEQKDEQLQLMASEKEKAIRSMQELMQEKEDQILQMTCDHDKALENMKILLQQKEEQREFVKKTLKEEVLKLKLEKKDLESQIQTCDELENEAKKFAKLSEERQEEVENFFQREAELVQKLSDAQKEISDLEGQRRGSDKELIQTRMDATETVKRYKEKVKKLCETLKLQGDQENQLRHMIDSLRKQNEALEQEKENAVQEGSKVVDRQCQREMELSEQLGIFEDENNQLRKALDDQAKREEELREEYSIEMRKIRESARVKREKLLIEIDELNNDKLSSTKASRKLINELRNRENELLEKIDELRLDVRSLEGQKRKISMEYQEYQSDTQTSRNGYIRMHEDLKILREKNDNLQAQLSEMKLKESCLLKDKQFLEQRKEENEMKNKKNKEKIQKQENEINRLLNHERDLELKLKKEIMEMRGKISAAEDERVRYKAEHRSQENRLMHEAKVANAKISELQLYVIKKRKAENNLKETIEDLKQQLCELNRAVESEQLDKAEIISKNSINKGHIIELENSIDKKDQEIKRLDRSIGELRAQNLRLQHQLPFLIY